MKILMLGPAQSESRNYGFGLATENIAKQVSAKTELTIISPVAATQLATNTADGYTKISVEDTLLSNRAVDSSAVQITIETPLTPYFYHALEQNKRVEEQNSTFEVQEALRTYTASVVKETASLDYDVVYAHDWLSIEAALQLKGKFNKPMVLHIHSLDFDRVGKQSGSWIYKLEKEGMEKADIVIAVSHYHAAIMNKHYGIAKNKIKVVHLATSKGKSKPYTSPFDEAIVLFAGRLSHQKGIFTFIELAEALLNSRKDVRFVVAGDGELSQEVVSRINERELGQYVNFTGRIERDELHGLMLESRVMVMPSVSEPFGLVALEAALNGLPIVTSNNCGVNEMLPGCIIPKTETEAAYLKAIEAVLEEDPSVLKGVKANKEAATKRTWQQVGDELLSILTS